jgi:hypothetical protein
MMVETNDIRDVSKHTYTLRMVCNSTNERDEVIRKFENEVAGAWENKPYVKSPKPQPYRRKSHLCSNARDDEVKQRWGGFASIPSVVKGQVWLSL